MKIKYTLSGLLVIALAINSYTFPENNIKNLLARKWKSVKVIENGKEQALDVYAQSIEFAKDGACHADGDEEGKWHLLANQSDVVIEYNYDSLNDTISIVKIDSTQLILRMKEDNVATALYLKPVIPLDFVPQSNAQTKLLMKKWKIKQMLVDGKPSQNDKGQIIKLNPNGEFEDEAGVDGIWKVTKNKKELLFRYYDTDEEVVCKIETLTKDLFIMSFSIKNQLFQAHLIPFLD